MPLITSVTDLTRDAETLRRRRYGVIEVIDGRFHRVLLRPWPKILVGPEVLWFGKWLHQRQHGDRILLYYNQPWRCPTFWPWPMPFPPGRRACDRSAWAWRYWTKSPG